MRVRAFLPGHDSRAEVTTKLLVFKLVPPARLCPAKSPSTSPIRGRRTIIIAPPIAPIIITAPPIAPSSLSHLYLAPHHHCSPSSSLFALSPQHHLSIDHLSPCRPYRHHSHLSPTSSPLFLWPPSTLQSSPTPSISFPSGLCVTRTSVTLYGHSSCSSCVVVACR